jgi:chemotaxis protein methyltransferase CheR
MGDMTLSPQLYAIFSQLVEEACGIHYSPQDRELFGTKLASQAADAGYESLLDYYYRLRYDDPNGVEMRGLIQALVVHETYFFREPAPLVELVDGHLTQIIRARGRARVWSAACSTGEEPLTMAMLLADRGLLDKVEIVGTDISEAAIVRASSGRHGTRSLRSGYPAELALRHLDVTSTCIVVAPRLRDAIRLLPLNLLDENAVRDLGTFDVILCRNVLIYFRDTQVMRVIETLTQSLAADGVLAVGISESLLRFGTMLLCEERSGSFFYRKAP